MDDHAASPDLHEILDWKDSLNDVLRLSGPGQAGRILQELDQLAAEAGVSQDGKIRTPYVNTIAPTQESPFPLCRGSAGKPPGLGLVQKGIGRHRGVRL